MTKRLDNYVRTFRIRAGLSQEEVAYLLGCRTGSKVSRYERMTREPSLRSALAYGALFCTPIHELFAGMHDRAERAVVRRAMAFIRRLNRRPLTTAAKRKLECVQSLLRRIGRRALTDGSGK